MKKILITGGAGFIGSNFIHYILKKYKNYQIVNLDKLNYCGNLENLKDIEKNSHYKFIKGDIGDKDLVDNLLKNEKPDAIINFAAMTHVDRSILDAEEFIKTNILGVQILLEASRKYKISRFIQISTDEVYGSILKGKFKETDILDPSSPYSASKAAAELLALSYFKTYNLPVLITRSSNNYGPFQYPEKLIPLFVTNLLEGKKVPIYGDGKQVRDWLYVLDNSRAIDLVLHKGKIGEIYNIGANSEKENIEITKNIFKILGKNESSIEYVKDRLAHDRRYAIDSSKIKKLGWKPEYKFSEAIKITVYWYKNNKNWWQRIKTGEYLKYYKTQYGKK
ncbi:MAG: dTDP-glucose 4,6-dehydratase [Patescibacteria group bacterium]|nr:dTDP-glucose 4,6-dehydratase [Patescibacteria group bacterium]MDD5164110.1 dTDP-glucose 4,6-dehydratase [Patescibacteria group bacterium]MDD5534232.1 dTDP-glucose 4,6-dehydratase [Patescibacteria group bacterium]